MEYKELGAVDISIVRISKPVECRSLDFRRRNSILPMDTVRTQREREGGKK